MWIKLGDLFVISISLSLSLSLSFPFSCFFINSFHRSISSSVLRLISVLLTFHNNLTKKSGREQHSKEQNHDYCFAIEITLYSFGLVRHGHDHVHGGGLWCSVINESRRKNICFLRWTDLNIVKKSYFYGKTNGFLVIFVFWNGILWPTLPAFLWRTKVVMVSSLSQIEINECKKEFLIKISKSFSILLQEK